MFFCINFYALVSAFSQDGVTELRFNIPILRLKQQQPNETMVSDIEQQAAQDSDPWEWRNKGDKSYNLDYYLKRGSRSYP